MVYYKGFYIESENPTTYPLYRAHVYDEGE